MGKFDINLLIQIKGWKVDQFLVTFYTKFLIFRRFPKLWMQLKIFLVILIINVIKDLRFFHRLVQT